MTHDCDHVGVGGCCQQDSDCSTVCNPGGTCNTGTGVCQPGAPLNCDDHDACTTDSCDPMSGCVHDSVDCNSHSPCIMDSCDPMSGCVHTSITGCCTADGDCSQDFCTTGVQTCMDNTCQPPGMPADCDDSNPCTDDSCDAGACQHSLNFAPCGDGMCDGAGTCVTPTTTTTTTTTTTETTTTTTETTTTTTETTTTTTETTTTTTETTTTTTSTTAPTTTTTSPTPTRTQRRPAQ